MFPVGAEPCLKMSSTGSHKHILSLETRSICRWFGLAVQQNQCLEGCLDSILTALVTSLLATSGERQNWEKVKEKTHLKYFLPSGAPFPPLFGSLICWGGHNCPCPSLLCMCMYMTWLGRVPGNFIVFPVKTWSRKHRFTCHHTSWKSSGLSFLLLLVSCGLWFKWSLQVNWCSCSIFLPLMDSFKRRRTGVCCFHKDSHLLW